MVEKGGSAEYINDPAKSEVADKEFLFIHNYIHYERNKVVKSFPRKMERRHVHT